MNMDSSIEKTLTEIQKVMSANSIIGTPVETDDQTVIPISKTALGFGIGVANNSGKSSTELGGVGGGGSIDPVAFIVISHNVPGPEGVQIIPVDQQNDSLESLLSGIGKFVFDIMGNSTVEPATEEDNDAPDQGSIDKIKTKIKPSSSNK